ncbi:MAG: flagellar basal body-associated FliL family protein [Desulfobacteraceae bacterium]|nr:flagellar basal body-associated FliL family protein [Desulfobacteraceae bacterium]
MSQKVLIIVLGVVVLMMLAMGGGFFLMWSKMNTTIAEVKSQNGSGKDGEEAKNEEEEGKIGPILKLDTMIVNLADQGGKRYLRVTMELELSGKEVEEEINKRLPQVRDAILMVLPSKTYNDISTTEGKVALRDELLAKINALLKTGTVKVIYFTEFVVQ